MDRELGEDVALAPAPSTERSAQNNWLLGFLNISPAFFEDDVGYRRDEAQGKAAAAAETAERKKTAGETAARDKATQAVADAAETFRLAQETAETACAERTRKASDEAVARNAAAQKAGVTFKTHEDAATAKTLADQAALALKTVENEAATALKTAAETKASKTSEAELATIGAVKAAEDVACQAIAQAEKAALDKIAAVRAEAAEKEKTLDRDTAPEKEAVGRALAAPARPLAESEQAAFDAATRQKQALDDRIAEAQGVIRAAANAGEAGAEQELVRKKAQATAALIAAVEGAKAVESAKVTEVGQAADAALAAAAAKIAAAKAAFIAADEKRSEQEKKAADVRTIPAELLEAHNALKTSAGTCSTKVAKDAGSYSGTEDINAALIAEKKTARITGDQAKVTALQTQASQLCETLKEVRSWRQDYESARDRCVGYQKMVASESDAQKSAALKLTNAVGKVAADFHASVAEGFYSLCAPGTIVLEKNMEPFFKPMTLEVRGILEDDVASGGAELRAATEKYLPRDMNRANIFFESRDIAVAQSPEDLAAAAKANQKIADAGRAILYSTGDYAELTAFMEKSKLPQDWWPPQLVESVQAWRKTQRALNDEAVQKMAEGAKKVSALKKLLEGAKDQVKDFVSAPSDAVSTTSTGVATADVAQSSTPNDGAHLKADHGDVDLNGQIADVGAALNSIAAILDIINTTKDLADVFKGNDSAKKKALAGLPKVLTILDDLSGLTSSAFSMGIDFSTNEAANQVLQFAPIIGLVTSLMDTAQAGVQLAQDQRDLTNTRSSEKQAKTDFAKSGQDKAAVLAMQQSTGRAEQNRNQSTVNVVGKSVSAVGTGVTHSGLGALGGTIIQVVGSAITVGGKIVFKAIDWTKAQKAQKTLKEAQAGNMVAQNEVFADSGFYAKMYICMLCREKNPMAEKFLVDRGLTEGDLNSSEGLRILRESLLKSSRETDDRNVKGTALQAMFGNTAGAALDALADASDPAKVATAVATAASAAATFMLTKTYVETWKAGTAAELKADTWSTVKKGAIGAGLIDADEGVFKALGDAAGPIAAADALVQAQAADEAARTGILAAIDAVRNVSLALQKVVPETFVGTDRVSHKGMQAFLDQMAIKAFNQTESYRTYLGGKQLYQENWQPVDEFAGIGDLVRAKWDKLWKEGMKVAALPAAPAVASGFAELESALATLATAQGQALRKQLTACRAACGKLNAALATVPKMPELIKQTKLASLITKIMLLVTQKQRELDEGLAGGGNGLTWTPQGGIDATKPETFGAAWTKTWTYATGGGFCDPALGDADLGKKLEPFAKSMAAVAAPLDSQDKLKAYHEMDVQLADVMLTAGKFTQIHREAASGLTTFATDLAAAAKKAVEAKKAAVKPQNVAIALPVLTAIPGHKAWEKVYEEVLAANAILKSGSNESRLFDALKVHGEKKGAYDTAAGAAPVDGKKLRKAADEYSAALKDLMDAVAQVSAYKGYGEQPQLKVYLETLEKLAMAAYSNIPLQDAVNGTGGNLTAAAIQVGDLDGWHKTKESAIKEGIIPDKETGMKACLKAFVEADKEYRKTNVGYASQEVREDAQQALVKIVAALTKAAALSKKDQWVTYVNDLLVAYKAAGRDFYEIKFDKGAADLTVDKWRAQEKIAIERGIIADAKTGVSDAITGYLKSRSAETIALLKSKLDGVKTLQFVTGWSDYVKEMKDKVVP